MLTVKDLKPLQRQALREMLHSPTHALVRLGGSYIAQHPRESTSGLKQVQSFTYRLVRMLERDYLADFDEPEFPTRVTLTALGESLAAQLVSGADTEAGAA